MSKMKAHQRLNKCYRERYTSLRAVLECAKPLTTFIEQYVYEHGLRGENIDLHNKLTQQAIADYGGGE